MQQTDREDRIDFFDFLYELWRDKWVALGTMIIVVAVMTGVSVLRGQGFLAKVSPPENMQLTARIPVSVIDYSDPYGRQPVQILADLVNRLASNSDLNLQYLGRAPNTSPLSANALNAPRGFSFFFWEDANVGYIILNFADGDRAIYRQAYEAFQAASLEQFEEARQAAQGVVDEMSELVSEGQGDVSRELAMAVRFLATPSIKDGSFRFMNFGPMELLQDTNESAPVGGGPSSRTLVLGSIVGFIVACIVVMFRIAIRQRDRFGSP